MTADPWEDGFDTWTPPGDRDALQELARGLAATRGSEQARAQDEVEELKRALRERAAAAEEYLRHVEKLRRGIERAPSPEIARLRAEAQAELALAQAERDRLEERERAVHDVERELAGLRIELTRERQELEALRAELEARDR